jgi:predicted LPLAT superfamily acyltransferase
MFFTATGGPPAPSFSASTLRSSANAAPLFLFALKGLVANRFFVPCPFPMDSPSNEEATPSSPQGFGSAAGMRLLAFLMRVAPRFVVYAFALVPVLWYYVTRPEGRFSSKIYQRRLGLRYGPLRRFLFGLRQARELSRVILDNMYLGLLGPGCFRLERLGTQRFHEALEEGRGLVLLAAHVGNWHLAATFLHNTGRTVHLVTAEVRHPEVQRQMDLAKGRSSHLVIHDARGGVGLLVELRAALGRGEVVIMAGDRAEAGSPIAVPFLGQEALFPTTPFHLALATGAPVCTALSFRTGLHRYVCYGLGPYRVVANGRADRQAAVERALRTFVGHLEELLRRHPTQWYNFFDFWSDKISEPRAQRSRSFPGQEPR